MFEADGIPRNSVRWQGPWFNVELDLLIWVGSSTTLNEAMVNSCVIDDCQRHVTYG
jgi:hypothetical protein